MYCRLRHYCINSEFQGMLWRQFEFLYCVPVWGPQVGGHLAHYRTTCGCCQSCGAVGGNEAIHRSTTHFPPWLQLGCAERQAPALYATAVSANDGGISLTNQWVVYLLSMLVVALILVIDYYWFSQNNHQMLKQIEFNILTINMLYISTRGCYLLTFHCLWSYVQHRTVVFKI